MNKLLKTLTTWVCVLSGAGIAGAQMVSVSGPETVSTCEQVEFTATFTNLADVYLTNMSFEVEVAAEGIAYVTNTTWVRLPNGRQLSDGDFEPDTNGAPRTLAWELSDDDLTTPSGVDHVLISEVYYHGVPSQEPTNTNFTADSYQWVEFYNPTTNDIDMSGYVIWDENPGDSPVYTIPDGTVITPGGFLLLAGNTNAFFEMHPDLATNDIPILELPQIELDGGRTKTPEWLYAAGDAVILKDAGGAVVDAMSYGIATRTMSPSVSTTGDTSYSLQRSPASTDTGKASDWTAGPQQPMHATLPPGLAPGGVIQFKYTLEMSCEANTGVIRNQFNFNPEVEGKTAAVLEYFLSVLHGDLVVTKTPRVQTAGLDDVIEWDVTVENYGFGPAANVMLWDTLGGGLAYESFQYAPANVITNVGSTVAVWSPNEIPALTRMEPGDKVTFKVSARVTGCDNLYNRLDAEWGCDGLAMFESATCENTADEDSLESARAAIERRIKAPSISVIPDRDPLEIAYCGGEIISVTVTNLDSTEVSTAYHGMLEVLGPKGWVITQTDTNGLPLPAADEGVTLAPGESTHLYFTVNPDFSQTGCDFNPETEYFILVNPKYQDGCGTAYEGPVAEVRAAVGAEPSIRISKIMTPDHLTGSADSVMAVTVRLEYTNMVGNEVATIVDSFPALSANLSISGISDGGTLSGNDVTWQIDPDHIVLTGSGVKDLTFNVSVTVQDCTVANGIYYNELNTSDFTDCHGCSRKIVGPRRYPFKVYQGSGCGGTNSCHVSVVQALDTNLVEVCSPVWITVNVSGLTGVASNNWPWGVFRSNLGRSASDASYACNTDTNEIRIYANGSGTDLSPYASFTVSDGSLTIDFNGLNGYVTSTNDYFMVMYPLYSALSGNFSVESSFRVCDATNYCCSDFDMSNWTVGDSSMDILLTMEPFSKVCGEQDSRIRLMMQKSPQSATNGTYFDAYDVQVELNLDVDTNGMSGLLVSDAWLDGIVDLDGNPLTSVSPVLTYGAAGDVLSAVWDLGDIGIPDSSLVYTNRAGEVVNYDPENLVLNFKYYQLCNIDDQGEFQATLRYNNRCADLPAGDLDPADRLLSAESDKAEIQLVELATGLNMLEPSRQALASTNIYNTVIIRNTSDSVLANLHAAILLPPGIEFSGAQVQPISVTPNYTDGWTRVLWDFTTISTNEAADLGLVSHWSSGTNWTAVPAWESISFTVTNVFTPVACDSTNIMKLQSWFGCDPNFDPDTPETACASTDVDTASWDRIAGSLQTWVTFPVTNTVCEPNLVETRIRNTGLVADYDVMLSHTLPDGIVFVPGSLEIQQGSDTNFYPATHDPEILSNKLTWTSAEIPELAVFDPLEEMALRYYVTINCDINLDNSQFIADGSFADLCGNVVTSRKTYATMTPLAPYLDATVTASPNVADTGDTVTFPIKLKYSSISKENAKYVRLTVKLPDNVHFDVARVGTNEVAPTSHSGDTYVWDFTNGIERDSEIDIKVDVDVDRCKAVATAEATVQYGCNESNLCFTSTANASFRSTPNMTLDVPPGDLTLTACGGDKTFHVANRAGATAVLSQLTDTPPTAYTYATPAWTSDGLAPEVSAGMSFVINADGQGVLSFPTNAVFPNNASATVTFHYIATPDSTGFDRTANPTDYDWEDTSAPTPSTLTAGHKLDFFDSCETPDSIQDSLNAFPSLPDLDICLKPDSLATMLEGDTTNLVVRIENHTQIAAANADALSARVTLALGGGFQLDIASASDITATGKLNNQVLSGTGWYKTAAVGDTNFFFQITTNSFFRPSRAGANGDYVEFTVPIKVVRNGKPLSAVAEVVGWCDDTPQTFVYTNTLGETAFADTLSAPDFAPVLRSYHSFDQDRFLASGSILTKSVRCYDEAPSAGGPNRILRVGEPFVWRVRAEYFGGPFSNAVVRDIAADLHGYNVTNVIVASVEGDITNALISCENGTDWSAAVQPDVFANGIVEFDLYAYITNNVYEYVADGMAYTNIAWTDYRILGDTNWNIPTIATATVDVVESRLAVRKLITQINGTALAEPVEEAAVQAGDTVTYVIQARHTDDSHTNAYNLVITDLLDDADLTYATNTASILYGDNAGAREPNYKDVAYSSGATTLAWSNDFANSYYVVTNFPVTNEWTSLLQFDAKVGLGAELQGILTNTATLRWQSVPEEIDAVTDNARDGWGPDDPNNYVTTSNAYVTLEGVSFFSKTYLRSSQTNTLDYSDGVNIVSNDLTIGERVVYEFCARLNPGTMTGAKIIDYVPTGLVFVGDNPDPKLSFPGRGFEVELPQVGAGGLYFDKSLVTATVNSDGWLIFDFPGITNVPPLTDQNNWFKLKAEFYVANLPLTDNTGTTLDACVRTNTALFTNFLNSASVTSTPYRVVEPKVSIRKSVSTNCADAGDYITYTIEVENSSVALADAYNIRVDDVFPADVFDTVVSTVIPPNWTGSVDTNGMHYTLDENVPLPPASTATFQVTLTGASMAPWSTYTNIVAFTNSSTLYDRPATNIPPRLENGSADAEFYVPEVSSDKALQITSERITPPDLDGAELQVGETVTYRIDLTMPEGQIDNLVITDTPRGPGLCYIKDSLTYGDTNMFVFDPTAVTVDFTTGTNPAYSAENTDVIVAIPSLRAGNPAATNLMNRTFTFYLSFLNNNVDGNVNGVSHSNTVSTLIGTNSISAGPVVTVTREPNVALTKSVSPTNGLEAGDTVTVTLVATNEGTAGAYNFSLTDVLNTNIYDPATLANVTLNPSAGFTNSFDAATSTFRVDFDGSRTDGVTNVLDVGASLTVTFDVNLSQGVTSSSTYTNRADIYYTSIRGTGPEGVYREYTNNASATFSTKDPEFEKTLLETSEDETPPDSQDYDLQIGETVTYRLSTTLPAGTYDDFRVKENLRYMGGLQFVEAADTSIANGFNGTIGTVTFNSSDFGIRYQNVVASTNDAAGTNHTLTFDLIFLVTNVVANTNGAVKINQASVKINGWESPVSSVTNTIIEPKIAVEKSFSRTNDLQAGDVVRVTLTASNTGTAALYDVTVEDVLDDTVFDVHSVAIVAIPNGFHRDDQVAEVIRFTSDNSRALDERALCPNDSRAFIFDVTLAQGVEPYRTYTNFVTLSGDSISDGGPLNEQRPYGATNSATLSTTNLWLEKALDSTSETVSPPDSTGHDVQIGETETFAVTVHVPAATITNLTLTDTSRAGDQMTYLTNRIDWTDFTGDHSTPPTVTSDSTNLTLTFPRLVPSAEGSFTVYVTMLTTTNSKTKAGNTLVNRAVLTYDGLERGRDEDSVRVVEPVISVTKSLPSTKDNVQAGDVLTVTLTASNSGTAALYDVTLTDPLDEEVFDWSTVTNFVCPTGFVARTEAPNLVLFESDTNAAPELRVLGTNETKTFTFDVTIAQTVRPSPRTGNENKITYTNKVTLVGDSIDGPGPENEQREYSKTADARIRSRYIKAAKTLRTTSERVSPPDSEGADLQVGETATYDITLTIPACSITGTNVLTVDDSWSVGLIPVGTPPYEIVATNFQGTYTVKDPGTVTSNGIAGLALGDMVVTNRSDLIIRVTLAADDQASVTNGAQLVNTVEPKFNGSTVTNTSVTNTVVEPKLEVTKAISPNAALEAGDTVRVTLTAKNTGTAALYDAVVEDVLDPAVFVYSSVTDVAVAQGFVRDANEPSGTVRYISDTNATAALRVLGTNETKVFTFDVTLAQSVSPYACYTNWTTLSGDSISNAGPVDIERDYVVTNRATLTMTNMVLIKVLEETSEKVSPPDSTTNKVQIGETATFRIRVDVPAGTIDELTVEDTSLNAAELQYVTNRIDWSSFTGTPKAPTVTSDSTNLTLTFADLEPTAPGQIYVFVTMLTTTNAAGQAGSVLTNHVVLKYVDRELSDDATVEVVEPEIGVGKAISPNTNRQGGDVVTITLTATNSGTAALYDVTVEDVLDPKVYDYDSVTNETVATGFVRDWSTPGTVRYISDTNAAAAARVLGIGETKTFTFDVKVALGVEPYSVYTNGVTLRGDSISNAGPQNVQWTYEATNTATLATTNPTLTKVLIATGETNCPPDSTTNNLQIGERAIYDITVTVPAGTYTNFAVQDLVASGGQTQLVYKSHELLTNGFGGNLVVAKAQTNSGVQVFFAPFTNSVSNSTFTLRVDMIISNDVATAAGNRLENMGISRYNTKEWRTPRLPVYVVEPIIAVGKAISPNSALDAGDVVTVTLTATNTGTAALYDVTVADVLDPKVFDFSTVSATNVPAGFALDLSETGTVKFMTSTNGLFADQALGTNETKAFTFQVALAQAIEPSRTYTNFVTLAGDSIRGTGAFDDDEQRTYGATNSATLSTTNGSISKVLQATGETGEWRTAGSDVAIGEDVWYDLSVTLPEGTLTNLTVADALPSGMKYVGVEVRTNGFAGTLAPVTATTNASGVTFAFDGDCVVTGDNVSTNNTFVLRVQARVKDVAANYGTVAGNQTVMTNTASLAYGEFGTDAPEKPTVTVVEPVLGIEKSMWYTSNRMVAVTLTVTNSGLATAWAPTWEDDFPTNWWTGTFLDMSISDNGFKCATTNNGAKLVWSAKAATNGIPVGGAVTVSFLAQMNEGMEGTVTNLAEVTGCVTLSAPTDEMRTEPGTNDTATLTMLGVDVTKAWDDFSDAYGTRPTNLTAHLFANGTELTNATAAWSKSNNLWTAHYTGLPVKVGENGTDITYTATEDVPDGYSGSWGGLALTNAMLQTNATVLKVWDDRDNADGTRPASVTIELLRDGASFAEPKTVVLGTNNNWTYTWTNLPAYQNNSTNLSVYTAKEGTVPNGYSSVTNGLVVTNSLLLTNAVVEKVWDDLDDVEGTRPGYVTFDLLRDGEVCRTALLSSTNNWTYEWTNLPVYKNGSTELSVYTASETNVPNGYAVSGDGLVLTNSLTRTNATVLKVWNDLNDAEGTRPTSVTFELWRDGAAMQDAKSVTLSESNSWTYTWTNLPAYQNGSTNLSVYTAVETTVPNGYEAVTNGLTITNNLVVTNATVLKVWDDLNNVEETRPTGVTFELWRDGVAMKDAKSVTLNDANGWTYEWTNLPAYQNGSTELSVYTAVETTVPNGYEAVTNGLTVTNTLITTNAVVVKVWDDLENAEDTRPGCIQMELWRDGAPMKDAKTVWLSVTNGWTNGWDNLPMYQNGSTALSAYTAVETAVPGGYASATNGLVVTNTLLLTNAVVTKVWDDKGNADNTRPPTLGVTLLRDNVEFRTATLSAANSWSNLWTNLPAYQNGTTTPSVYAVVEADVPGYTGSTNVTGNVYALSNALVQTNATITKTWVDSADVAARPTSLTVQLLRDDELYDTATLTEDNSWSATWSTLPTFQNNSTNLSVYVASEPAVPARYASETNGLALTDTLATTNAAVTKAWVDSADTNARPATLTVDLLRDGEVWFADQVLAASNGWTLAWTNLPLYNATNAEAESVWTVLEKDVPADYEGATNGATASAAGYKLVNTLATTNAEVTKIWDDSADTNARPASVTVDLLRDGEVWFADQVLAASNGWTLAWSNLPAYRKNTTEESVYTVVETSVPAGYAVSGTNGAAATEAGYALTNTLASTNIVVTKTWNDEDNADSTRPDSLEVVLLRDTVEFRTATLSAANSWSNLWTNLPIYVAGTTEESVYVVVEAAVPGYAGSTNVTGNVYALSNALVMTNATITKTWVDSADESARPTNLTVQLLRDGAVFRTAELAEDNNWSATWTNLPFFQNNSTTQSVYTVSEPNVPARYAATTNGLALTNVLATTNAAVTKVWADSTDTNARPASITVDLLRDGDVWFADQVLAATNGWTMTWMNLPLYNATNAAAESIWTVLEKDVPADYAGTTNGTSASLAGYQLVNTLATTNAEVTKIWDDSADTNARPASITVNLLRDGDIWFSNQVVSAANGWKLEWSNLPAYKQNTTEPSLYTVEETPVPVGYSVSGTNGAAATEAGYALTNKLASTNIVVTKTWMDDENMDSTRPTNLVVTLLRDTVEFRTATLSAANSWTNMWTNLPVYVAGTTTPSVYKVVEADVPGYTGSRNEDGYVYALTNTLITTDISATKVWEGDQGLLSARPDSVGLELMRGTNVVRSTAVTGSKDETDWQVTWSNVPAYEPGTWTPCTYTVAEPEVPFGYEATTNGLTVVNKLAQPIFAARMRWTPEVADASGLFYGRIDLNLLGGNPTLVSNAWFVYADRHNDSPTASFDLPYYSYLMQPGLYATNFANSVTIPDQDRLQGDLRYVELDETQLHGLGIGEWTGYGLSEEHLAEVPVMPTHLVDEEGNNEALISTYILDCVPPQEKVVPIAEADYLADLVVSFVWEAGGKWFCINVIGDPPGDIWDLEHLKTYYEGPFEIPAPVGTQTATVTLDANGGTIPGAGSSESLTATNGMPMPASAKPTKSGYTFQGYYDDAGGRYYDADMNSSRNWDGGTTDKTLKARWTKTVTTKVTLDPNGGKAGTKTVTATRGSPMPAATAPTKAGCQLIGFFTLKKNGIKYYNSDMTSANKWPISDKTYTLYAHWKTATAKITLDPNGGTAQTKSVTATYGKALPSAKAPTRAGYVFQGFYTAKSGGTMYYDASMKSKVTWKSVRKTYTLYAHWKAKTATVAFDANGGKLGTASAKVTYDKALPTVTRPTRSGYAFLGYYNKKDGGTQYWKANGKGARNWNGTASKYTFYAHWARISTVTINKAGGSGGTSKVVVTNGVMPRRIGVPTREGYTLLGIFNKAEGGAKYWNADGTPYRVWNGTAATYTFYAQWMRAPVGLTAMVGGELAPDEAEAAMALFDGDEETGWTPAGAATAWDLVATYAEPVTAVDLEIVEDAASSEDMWIYVSEGASSWIPLEAEEDLPATFQYLWLHFEDAGGVAPHLYEITVTE